MAEEIALLLDSNVLNQLNLLLYLLRLLILLEYLRLIASKLFQAFHRP